MGKGVQSQFCETSWRSCFRPESLRREAELTLCWRSRHNIEGAKVKGIYIVRCSIWPLVKVTLASLGVSIPNTPSRTKRFSNLSFYHYSFFIFAIHSTNLSVKISKTCKFIEQFSKPPNLDFWKFSETIDVSIFFFCEISFITVHTS